MNDNIKLPANDFKEFIFNYDSIAYYYNNKIIKTIIVWHNCSNEPIYYNANTFKKKHLRKYCQHCGQHILEWKNMNHEIVTQGGRLPVYNFSYINKIKISIVDLKIRIGIFRSAYCVWETDKAPVFTKSAYYTQYTMNLKTGYTYQLEYIKLGQDSVRKNSGKIQNISYKRHLLKELSADVLTYLCSIINDNMKSVHGDKIPDFESYSMKLTFDNLIAYVRMPHINPLMYNHLINFISESQYGKMYKKQLLIKNDCTNPISQLLKQLGIPDVRSFRKIEIDNPIKLLLLSSISKVFKNVDLILALYMAIERHYNYKRTNMGYNPANPELINFSHRLFKTMIKHKGENIIASKLISFAKNDTNNNTIRTLCDMISCFDRLKTHDFDFSSNYNIDNLHLSLAESIAKQEHKIIDFNYTKYDYSLEKSDDTYALTLPRNTFELSDIGKKMHICVGSYGRFIIDKFSLIYILWEKESVKPVGCIELRNDTIVQAKSSYNRLLQDQELTFTKKWINERKLSVRTSDITNLHMC
jgi:hypothetical protein